MFEDRKIDIPELDQLRSSLVEAATTEHQAARRTSRRKLGFALAGGFALAATVALLLVLNPLGQKVGVEAALASVAARIELLPETPADRFVDTRNVQSRLWTFPAGFDRMMQPHPGFAAISNLDFEVWLSRRKKGATRGTYLPPSYPTERDREVGERVLAASRRWKQLQETPEGRRAARPIGELYTKWFQRAMKDGSQGLLVGDPGDFLMPSDENGEINPDGTYHVGAITLEEAEVKRLQRDPVPLFVLIRQQANLIVSAQKGEGGPRDDVNELIWMSLTQGSGGLDDTLPADLRASFVKALEFLPGIEALGRQSDSKGREGDAFKWVSNGLDHRIVFDARTSVPLEVSVTLVDPERAFNPTFRKLTKGTLIERRVLDYMRTVDEVPTHK